MKTENLLKFNQKWKKKKEKKSETALKYQWSYHLLVNHNTILLFFREKIKSNWCFGNTPYLRDYDTYNIQY